MLDDEIKLLIRIAQKVAEAKLKLGIVADSHPVEFLEIRDSLNDIVDEMADHFNCPPIKLVLGKIEDIKRAKKNDL